MRIDLNADLGEGFGPWRSGDDESLLDVISSANIACGFHAGDPTIMRTTCRLAAERGVAIGAQVGYRDLAGFGRRRMDVPHDALAADVLYQLGALHACAVAAGARVRYVKPHGALYNTAADDPAQADAIAEAVSAFDPSLPVLGLPDSCLSDAASNRGIGFVAEAFADRSYLASGRLVPRDQPDALITDPSTVASRVLAMVAHNTVTAIDGTSVAISVASVCLHGDTPGAVGLARVVRAALEEASITVEPFAT